MSNTYFQFKQFIIHQDNCAMKVCTDACLFGAWIAQQVGDYTNIDSILDVGTGTGLLSLMVAQQSPAIIDAVELDEAAAEQARDNFELSPWKERLQVIQGDVRKIHFGKKYQLIISNPPFFEDDLKSADAKRNLALHSAALGFEEFLTVIKNYLLPEGKFAVLLPYHRKDAFIKMAAEYSFFPEKEIAVQQTAVHAYFRAMLLFTAREGPIKKSILIIREEDHYTEAFTELLNDYYLKL